MAGLFKRLFGYSKVYAEQRAEQAMDPEIQIEQAISEARERDQQLRNQAAKVVAHRSMIENQIDDAADNVGKAKELAKQALLKADAAQKAGNAAEVEKWERTAQSLASRLQAAQGNLDSLKQQLQVAIDQADDAKQAVQQNAVRVQELSGRRMQMLGSLQQAKMQETVNTAVQQMSATLESDGPSLASVEQKIDARLAESRASAELRAATPEGAQAELESAMFETQTSSTLDSLRAELGMSTKGELSPGPSS